MKTIVVNIDCRMAVIPNLEEMTKKEVEAVAVWKEQDFMENLFIKEDGNGAILVMKNVDAVKAKELVATLPLISYFQNVTYFETDKKY